jgi:hypothetical protein
MVLPSDESINEQDDDNGEAGKADGAGVLRFAKRGPTWTRIVWMQP